MDVCGFVASEFAPDGEPLAVRVGTGICREDEGGKNVFVRG